MSPTDDTQPNRGRPVLKRIDLDRERVEYFDLNASYLWLFCGEYPGRDGEAVDAACVERGPGIYKVFPSGSWPGGYLRD